MKKGIFILFTIVMLVFAGCGSSSGSGSSSSSGSGISLNSFAGGSKALEYEFAEGSPPEKIRDQGTYPFNVRLLIRNVGEYDIEEGAGHVAIKGVSAEDLGVSDLTKPIPAINGVRKQGDRVREGGRQYITYSGLKYMGDVGTGGFITFRIHPFVCYPYKTIAQTTLCLTGNAYQSIDDEFSTCKVDSTRPVTSSGSPFKIENVQEYASSNSEVTFQFDIVHTPTPNQGRVFRSGSLDSSCNVNGQQPSSTEAKLDEDYVQFSVVTGVPGLKCSNSNTDDGNGEIQLGSDGRATVICSQKTDGLEEHEKLVKISLSYDYLERLQKDIIVEHYGN
jgi:hypothetical protein